MFTIDTKMKDIASQPEFAGYEYMAGLFPASAV